MTALRLGTILLVAAVLCGGVAYAQDRPAFHNLRFEEDWSDFDPGEDAPFFDRLKHIDLSDNIWMSVGGELRLRAEVWDGAGFNDDNSDEYLLYRTFIHTDFHFGEHVRLFVQGRYSGLTDRDLPGGKRDALDRDQGDLWNTFLEFHGDQGKVAWHVRLGRQELQFGNQRLISPLDWSNNRRIFDGVNVRLEDPDGVWRVDVFSVSPVAIDGDSFTFNDPDDLKLFSGVYYSHKIGDKPHTVDAYLLSSNHIDYAATMEDRYTIGGRATGPIIDNLVYEVEAAYQFGDRRVDGLAWNREFDISAWMASADLTYTFAKSDWKPFLNVGVDYASGDRDKNDFDVNTFSQLYPLGHAYLGYIDAVGRQNIVDFRGSVGAWPIAKKLRIKADLHFFRRANEDDGLYHAGGAPTRSATFATPAGRLLDIDDMEVGQELDLTLLWKINPRISALFGYSHFWAGDFIDATGTGDDVDFFYSQLMLKF